MNFYQKHIGDYIKDTVILSMLEDGAYNRLIDQYYQTEKPLPLNKTMLYKMARATSTAERKAVDFVIASFFKATDDGYIQERCEEELSKYQEKSEKAKESAKARWEKSERNANASKTHDTSDMQTHSEGISERNANHKPITNKKHTAVGKGSETTTNDPVDNSKSPPPPPIDYEKFPMHPEWAPSDQFDTLCKIAGVKVGEKSPINELKEFRAYWFTRQNVRRSQNEWDHAFVKSLKVNQERQSGRWQDGGQPRENIAANSLYDDDQQRQTGGQHAQLK